MSVFVTDFANLHKMPPKLCINYYSVEKFIISVIICNKQKVKHIKFTTLV